jgi:hypothetical protein
MNTSKYYVEELDKLDVINRWSFGESPLLTSSGYFKFDCDHLEGYLENPSIANTLSRSTKFYIFGVYSQVCESLELLIKNDLHYKINMLDINIYDFDCKDIKWNLLSKFINLRLLNIDGSGSHYVNRILEGIQIAIPRKTEALCINYHWFNEPITLANSNIKVLKLNTAKFNQSLDNLPQMLETIIIKSGEFNQKVDNLPINLKNLVLLCPKMQEPMDYLPHGLEYFAGLHFNCFIYPDSLYQHNFHNLPKTIKYIMLDSHQYEKHRLDIEQNIVGCKISKYTNYNDYKPIINYLINIYNSEIVSQ